MTLELRCGCGQMAGEVDPAQVYSRATCHCRDCQAFAAFLGTPGITDAHGGTDVLAMAPGGIRITSGMGQVACMSLGPRGLLRWYAACCRSPIANTGRAPRPYYAGLVTTLVATPAAALDAAVGPRGRVVLYAKAARGEVRPTPVALALGGAAIGWNLLLATLRGRRDSPFFDAAGAPVRAPAVLSLAERRALDGR